MESFESVADMIRPGSIIERGLCETGSIRAYAMPEQADTRYFQIPPGLGNASEGSSYHRQPATRFFTYSHEVQEMSSNMIFRVRLGIS